MDTKGPKVARIVVDGGFDQLLRCKLHGIKTTSQSTNSVENPDLRISWSGNTLNPQKYREREVQADSCLRRVYSWQNFHRLA